MSDVMQQGILLPSQVSSATVYRLLGIAVNWYPNRNPLFSRLPKIGDGAAQFNMVGHKYRPRTVTLASNALSTDTTFTMTDASTLLKGDVLKVTVGTATEYIEVTADPNVTANTITVARAIQGTAQALTAGGSGGTLVLVGNSRTGGEDFPTAFQYIPTVVSSYQQTVEHPYAVGGSVQTNTTYALDGTGRTPLDQFRMDAMQNCTDDFEMSGIYGAGLSAAASPTGRPKMLGIKNRITTNNFAGANIPSDSGAYKATSFQRDLLQAPRLAGGQPDVVFVSAWWMQAFSLWGQPLMRFSPGKTQFGIDITAYTAPFLGDVTIVEHSLLQPGEAFSLTSEEVRWRVKRALADEPFGKTGDNVKGHIIGEMALEVDNEQHHAWLEGVTAFSV